MTWTGISKLLRVHGALLSLANLRPLRWNQDRDHRKLRSAFLLQMSAMLLPRRDMRLLCGIRRFEEEMRQSSIAYHLRLLLTQDAKTQSHTIPIRLGDADDAFQ
jgi:hypothetical protein